ncbi:acyl-CoA dehydratase activase [Pseudothermotoga sp.]|uniref:acyl-CoA dehydratase activase n=1 Tax=Pseudothermotoga sp. TaxID=2033661 RepID=UPI0031F68419
MIVYNCPLVPFEFFHALKIPFRRIRPNSIEFQKLHPNVCSFCRSAVCSVEPNDVLVWVDSCDSMRRAYDFLKKTNRSFYLHVPVKNDGVVLRAFADELRKLWEKLKEAFNREVPVSELEETHSWFLESSKNLEKALFEDPYKAKELFESLSNQEWIGSTKKDTLRVLLVGSWVSEELVKFIENSGACVLNATCSGPYALLSDVQMKNNVFESIASRILNKKLVCGRFSSDRKLSELVKSFEPSAVVLHTAKFCDFYHFDEQILEKLKVPFVSVEENFSSGGFEQTKTRIGALLESLKRFSKPAANFSYFIGIDSGSTSTKLVAVDRSGNILLQEILKTGADPKESAKRLLMKSSQELKISREDVFVVATGYGRDAIDFAQERVTEITCHAIGVSYLYENVGTIIDIGGQDSKVIRLENGKVVDFVMNDKCAAGTGRFLEIVASILETPIEALGEESLKAKQELNISSVCAVFAESEIISLRSKGYNKQDIIRAAHEAIARRIYAMYQRVKGRPPIVLTGGVALNKGLKCALEKLISVELIVPKNPITTGALGAALIGLQQKT